MSTRQALAKFEFTDVWRWRWGNRCIGPFSTNYPVKDCFDIKKILPARDRSYYGSVPIGTDCNNFCRVTALRRLKTTEQGSFANCHVRLSGHMRGKPGFNRKGNTLNVRSAFGEE